MLFISDGYRGILQKHPTSRVLRKHPNFPAIRTGGIQAVSLVNELHSPDRIAARLWRLYRLWTRRLHYVSECRLLNKVAQQIPPRGNH